jgi:hypothetical protein
MNRLHDAPIAVWLAGGIPVRIELAGDVYVVSDTPTPLEDAFYGLTHVPDLVGWRFQGTRDDGTTHMFDVKAVGGGWKAIRVYD